MNFSSRTDWLRSPNPLATAVELRRKAGREIVDLTNANPTTCDFQYPHSLLLAALSHPQLLHYTPEPKGLFSARKRVSAYYQTKNALVHPTFISLTSSTSESYSLLFKLLCNEGDNVLVPKPSYPLFDYLAQIENVQTFHYSLRYEGRWHLDIQSIRESINTRTRAIILIHPHNPTGHYLTHEEWESLREICRIHGTALIIDEVFLDYSIGQVDHRLATAAGTQDVLTFTLGGISKLCGLPQMKLGWIAMSGPDRELIEASERLEILCDTFLSVSTPIQLALPTFFHTGADIRRQILDRIHANYNLLIHSVEAYRVCSALHTEGGWYAIVRVPQIKSDEAWAISILEQCGILVHPGYFFDVSAMTSLVVSLLSPENVFSEAVHSALNYIRAHS